jgi:hypothetical protein
MANRPDPHAHPAADNFEKLGSGEQWRVKATSAAAVAQISGVAMLQNPRTTLLRYQNGPERSLCDLPPAA